MKNSLLFLSLFLLTNHWDLGQETSTLAPQEKIEILVNGELFDPDKKSLRRTDTIELRVANPENGAEYKFSEIKLEWLVKKKIMGMKYEGKKRYIYEHQDSQDGRRRHRMTYKHELAQDLDSCSNIGYQTFSKQGSVKVPYSQFAFLPCLSRVVFHLESIVKVKNQRTYTINPKDMNLSTKHKDDGISFFPNWDTCPR